MKKPKRLPRDPAQRAKAIVDLSTSEEPVVEPIPDADKPAKNPHAQALGQLGGRKGGRARAAKLTAAERSDIAKRAAAARWKKKTENS